MPSTREHLRAGVVIPAHPLALTAERTLDEKRQRALTRYYIDAGAGGIAVGVHTTQFAIRDSQYGLYRPVLELAAETAVDALAPFPDRPFVKVAGICGHTAQAISEAQIASALGYDVGLLSLGDWQREDERELLLHCREGWTLDEIATRLGVSRSMVKKHIAKAMLHCRQQMKGSE